MSGQSAALREMALKVHRERGEPPGYDGPCWGPTEDDIDEARRRLGLPPVDRDDVRHY